jgi:hypothetical protein
MSFTLDPVVHPPWKFPLELRTSFRPEEDVTAREAECALRHLAVAATRLARQEDLGRKDAARFAAAAARFRSLLATSGDIRGRPGPVGPVVETEAAGPVSLAALFIEACRRDRARFPTSAIDPDLVEAARELLCSLNWSLPDEAARASAG